MVLVLGMEDAGKTTLCHYLSSGHMIQNVPPHPYQDTVTIGNCPMTVFDLGGERAARRCITRAYWIDCQGIVFMVNMNQRDQFGEAKQKLDDLLSDEMYANIPVVILGGKVDQADAVSEADLCSALGVRTTGKSNTESAGLHSRPIEVFMTSVVKGQGINEAFEWLTQSIKSNNA